MFMCSFTLLLNKIGTNFIIKIVAANIEMIVTQLFFFRNLDLEIQS